MLNKKMTSSSLQQGQTVCNDAHTQFDGEAWRQLHLDELPEFIKVLEGSHYL